MSLIANRLAKQNWHLKYNSFFGPSGFTHIRTLRQRFTALFFVALMVTPLVLGPVVASAQSDQGTKDLLSAAAAAPLPIAQSNNIVAADSLTTGKPAGNAEPQESGGPGKTGTGKKVSVTPRELVDKRTATQSVNLNKNGSYTVRNYTSSHFYKAGTSWQTIDTKLGEDKNAGDSGNVFGKAWGFTESLFNGTPADYTVEKNDWKARFAPSDFGRGMVRIKMGTQQVGFIPVGAKAVKPVVTTKDGEQTVTYANMWQGVDVTYTVMTDGIKENIIVKNKSAANSVSFKVVGASVVAQKDGSFKLDGALGNKFSIAPPNLILNNFGYVDAKGKYSMTYKNGALTATINAAYLKSLPAKAFPAVLDPSAFRSNFGSRAGGNYVSFKTDGTICYSNVCNLYAGTLYDSNYNLQYWRGAFNVPYDQLRGADTTLQNANFHVTQRTNAGFWTGTYDGHNFQIGHATCLNDFNCVDGVWDSAWFGTVGDINVTNIYQYLKSVGDFGGWIMMMGEDGTDSSFKNFDPDNSWIDFTYNHIPPTPTIVTPSVDNQTFVDPQVGFQVAPTSDADGDPMQYYFRIATGGDGETGTVINSGNLSSTQWTVPDGILQDGTTYYLHAYTFDGTNYSVASPVRPFRIDSRRGKDKTQTYDTLGPVTVDLSTGNLSTSESSHTSTALAGSLGVSLDYNSPLRSRQGLVGEYWNVPANYAGGNPPTSPANVVRVDKNVDFNWDQGSPSSGTISPDWFYARWSGYFVAPKAGSYTFGGSQDDAMDVYVNNQKVSSNGCCGGPTYGTAVTLTSGQVVPLRVQYMEAVGGANAHLYVKGAVPEQIVPQAWLQTGARALAQQNGLVGHYYTDDGTHNLDATTKTQFLSRTDPYMSMNWGLGSPVPNGPADNFMVRWSGYLTVPTSGNYQFGTISDDGSRVRIGTANTLVVDKWYDDGGTEVFGSSVALTANQSVPITVDYYEHGGGAAMTLEVQGDVAKQTVPSSWLSPNAQVLPAGWNLGIDPDGNLGYDHLTATQNAAILTDSTGDTHQYTWTGSGYTPPVNEDGQLVRNADGTYTLNDVDGRTYVFGTDGVLQSVTNPVDDRKPAALQYSYSGSPAKITKITDGVDPARYAAVYYSGATNCTTPPSGFDAQAPANMLCAVATNDGRTTQFYYLHGNLARIVKPGNETVDYQYDTLGRIVALRDSVANDVVSAGVRANDTSTYTQITYDNLGRATGVTEPAVTTGAKPIQNTIQYLPGNGDGTNGTTLGITRQHVVGATEPYGFTRQVSYDNLFRTVADTDIAKLTTTNTWDPVKDLLYSSTDAMAMMSSTIYDADDRPVQQYGPAPASMFDDQSTLNTVSVTSKTSGKNDVFARAANGTVIHRTYVSGTGWSGWNNIGGCVAGSPAAVALSSTRMAVVGQSCADTSTLTYATYDNGTWSSWQQVAGAAVSSRPALVDWDGNRFDLVARGVGADAVHISYTFGTGWSAWESLGGCIVGTPAVTFWAPARLDVFVQGCLATGNLFQKVFINNAWTDYTNFSDFSAKGGVSAVAWDANRLDIFAQGINNDLIHKYYTPAGWGGTESLGGCMSDTPTVGSWGPNRLDVFAAGCSVNAADTTYKTWDGTQWQAWAQFNRTPLSTYAAQVPRTDTAYDEGIVGPAVAWFNYKSANGGALFGAPKLHTTGFGGNNDPSWIGRDFRNNAAPITPDAGMDGYGFSATGKIKFPASGTYTFNLWNDDGARLSINDTQLFSNWGTTTEGIAQNRQTGTFTAVAGQLYRFKLDYEHTGNPGALEQWLTGPGVTDISGQGLGTSHMGAYVVPDYSLQTSQTTYDSTLGNTTTKTNYGSNPELGLAQSVTLDPTGLNLTSTATYEQQGAAGGLLRQTSKTLPGGATTTYAYYGATETADNPCTTTVEAYREGGMLKLKTEPDPDGTGVQVGRTTQTIYDDAGRVVATRYNTDAWTCTSYDARGRVTSTVVPAYNSQAARTITNNYAVGGNPLIVSSMDSSGTITTQTDLSGATTSYTDAKGNATTSTYDAFGKLVGRSGPLGAEAFVYDTLNRLTDQKLDTVVIAHINYDSYSRIASVTYPTAGKQQVTYTRDTLGRLKGLAYTLGDGTTQIADAVTLSQSSQVVSGKEDGLAKSYKYDTSGRLTTATIGTNTFAYDYSAPSAATCNQPGANVSAQKDSNRTKLTMNGAVTTYCYDQADRLIASSDAKVGTPTYDTHGNTTQLGATTFAYDSSDRNSSIVEGSNKVVYARDAQGRLTSRASTVAATTITNSYGYTGAGDTPDIMQDVTGAVQEKYLQLPGNALLTVRPTQTTSEKMQVFSLPNIHGDIFATTTTSGVLSGTYLTGPFGEKLTTATPANGQTVTGQPAYADNTTGNATFGYVGQNEKFTEASFTLQPVQMGARVYIPILGRFLQVDPQEGGTPNDYMYPPDPVNDFDLTGEFGWKSFASIASIGSMIPGPIGMAASAVSAMAYAAAGDKKNAYLMAAGIALAAVGAGAAVNAYKIAKTAKVAEGFSGLGKAGRLTSALAGKMYVGRGASVVQQGGRKFLESADGLRRYGAPIQKAGGQRVANFLRRNGTNTSWSHYNRKVPRGFMHNAHLGVRGWW